MKKHFYTTSQYSLCDINSIINTASALKQGKISGKASGTILAMLFFNPSLRTRISFSAAIAKLGGSSLDLPLSGSLTYPLEFSPQAVMDKDKIEHIKDAVCCIAKYCDVIAVRASDLISVKEKSTKVSNWADCKKDLVIKSIMVHAKVPVINMESNFYHPCQGLADALTIKEHFGNSLKGKKYTLTWVPHPKALPMATPNSQLLSACDLGLDVVLACPGSWELDPEILTLAQKRAAGAGGHFSVTNNQKEAMMGADIVCVKSWGSIGNYGNWQKETEDKKRLGSWMIDKNKMGKTNKAVFLHCLPVRRNVEVTDEVLDSKNSLIYESAGNRLWVQMAVLLKLLKKRLASSV